VTHDRALERVRRLLALAGDGSGAPEEEARNAALAAAHLIVEHRLLDRRHHAVDLAVVTRLSLRVLELERLLAVERAARAAEIRGRASASGRRRA
jgi:hypothetical protein